MKKYLPMLGAVLVAFLIGRFSAPKSSETKSKEQTEAHEDQSKKRDQNVIEVVREIKRPDGTVIKTTTKEKKTSTETVTTKDTQATKENSTKIESRPGYRFGLGYQPTLPGFQETIYLAQIEKRLISELYVGVLVSSQKAVAITLSLGF